RIVEGSDVEAGFWWRWAKLVMRRPVVVGGIGIAIVTLLLISGSRINAAEAQLKAERGGTSSDAVVGYDRLVRDGFSPGALKPFVILAEGTTKQHDLALVTRALDR